jgi:hypothetical protein
MEKQHKKWRQLWLMCWNTSIKSFMKRILGDEFCKMQDTAGRSLGRKTLL